MFDHEARIRFYPHKEFRAAEMWILSTQSFGAGPMENRIVCTVDCTVYGMGGDVTQNVDGEIWYAGVQQF